MAYDRPGLILGSSLVVHLFQYNNGVRSGCAPFGYI